MLFCQANPLFCNVFEMHGYPLEVQLMMCSGLELFIKRFRSLDLFSYDFIDHVVLSCMFLYLYPHILPLLGLGYCRMFELD